MHRPPPPLSTSRGNMTDMEERLKGLREAALRKKSGISPNSPSLPLKRARSPSPLLVSGDGGFESPAVPRSRRRSRTLSRSPSRTPPRNVRGDSHSPPRTRIRSTPPARSRSPPPARSRSPPPVRSRSPRRARSRSPLLCRSRSPGRTRSRSPLKSRRRIDDNRVGDIVRNGHGNRHGGRDSWDMDFDRRRAAYRGGRGDRETDRDWERGRERGYREREFDMDRSRRGRGDHGDHRGRDGRWRDRGGRGRDRPHDWDRGYRGRDSHRGGFDREYGPGIRSSGRGPDSRRDERDARTVFVWQLSQKANEDDVYETFSRAGRVRNVQLIIDRRSHRHKGQGFVEYYHVSSVPAAVAMNGKHVCGYPVAVKATVEHAAPPPVTATGSGALENVMPQSIDFSPQPALPVVSAKPEPAEVPSPQPPVVPTPVAPKLVSIPELIMLLNPHNLPITSKPVTVSSLGDTLASAGSTTPATATIATADEIALPVQKQVPLPIPGTTPTTVPVALSAAQQQKQQSTFTRLYVGSVPFSVSEDDLLTVFSPFGTIVSLQLQREAGTGRSRGYGFVEYGEHASAKKALALNGIVLANRALKVNLASSTVAAPLTQQPLAAAQAAAASLSAGLGAAPSTGSANALPQNVEGELDEGNEGGLAMNAARRAQLMQRLSRGEDMGSLPSASTPPKYNLPCATTDKQTRCLLLSNMFDPVAESAANSAFDLDVAEDVRDEVSEKYGAVKHLFVDKNSLGLVYLIFDDVGSAMKARTGLNGRWFGGLCITADFVEEETYKKRVPDAPL